MKCDYCHTFERKKDTNQMNLEEYLSVIDQAYELGAQTVWIGGKGEPTMDPLFKPVVRRVADYDLPLVLNTNGTKITKELANFMQNNGVYPEFKIYSLDRARYEEASGVRGSYFDMRKGLDNLLKAGYGKIIEETDNSRITNIAGMTLLDKRIYNSIPEVIQFCKKRDIMPSLSNVIASGRVIKNRNLNEIRMPNEKALELYGIGSKIMGYPLIGGTNDCEIQFGMYIENDGRILATEEGLGCDLSGFFGGEVIGNVKNMSLDEAWKKMKKMRHDNEKIIPKRVGDSEECGACPGGCPMISKSWRSYDKRFGV